MLKIKRSRLSYGETGRQPDKQTGRQTNKQTDHRTNRHAYEDSAVVAEPEYINIEAAKLSFPC